VGLYVAYRTIKANALDEGLQIDEQEHTK
jgi:hypothetical protein